MGKGKDDPNCGSAPFGMSEISAYQGATPEEILAGMDSAERHPARGPKLQFTEQEVEDRQKRVERMTKQLEEDVQYLAEHPEQIEDWVFDMSQNRLWTYSWNNLWLARVQASARGFDVTRLASKTKWAEQGYKIRKGEKALKILRPVTKAVWTTAKDRDGNPLLDRDGKPKKVRRQIPVYTEQGRILLTDSNTWDISQMESMTDKEGKPLAQSLQPPTPSSQQAKSELSQIAQENGVQVFFGGAGEDSEYSREINLSLASRPDANGFYMEIPGREGESYRAIVTRPGLNPEEEARVLAHELGHALMHKDQAQYNDHEDRVRKEVEAESVAYVLSDHYGLPVERQAHYIAHWAKGQETEALRGAMDNIQRTVKLILGRAEEIGS